jgi:hypothetical protein
MSILSDLVRTYKIETDKYGTFTIRVKAMRW